MAKVAFTKLGLKVNTDIKTIDFNEQNIEVLQYLPVNDMLSLIADIVNLSADENNFANPIKLEVFLMVEMLYSYTNISFTEKQKEYFVDYYFNNLSFSEMAENYDVSRNAIFKQLHIVIDKLKEYEGILKLHEKRKKFEEIVKTVSDEALKHSLEMLQKNAYKNGFLGCLSSHLSV